MAVIHTSSSSDGGLGLVARGGRAWLLLLLPWLVGTVQGGGMVRTSRCRLTAGWGEEWRGAVGRLLLLLLWLVGAVRGGSDGTYLVVV